MSPGGWRGALAAFAVLLSATGGCGDGASQDEAPTAAEEAPRDASVPEVTLVFPSLAGALGREVRPVPLPQDPEERVAALVDALLAGPEEAGLERPFVEGVAVGAVHVDSHGVAYVDLVAPEQPDPPASGSRFEMLRVYSLVDTVLLNAPGLRAVVLLWNGRQRATFAGHVDTGRPLALDESLLAD